MKLSLAISLSLLGHGIVLMSWPGTADLTVNSTPSSFLVKLEQPQTKKSQEKITPVPNSKIKPVTLLKKTIPTEQQVSKNVQPEMTIFSDIRLNSEDKAYVVKRITAALENHFNYPQLARRNGWQGKVILALLLDADGSFENVHIKTGSGYNILDQSALNALQKIKKIDKTEHWFNIHSQEIIIPVIYRLQEG